MGIIRETNEYSTEETIRQVAVLKISRINDSQHVGKK